MKRIYRKPHRFKRKRPIYRNRFFGLGILILIFLFSIFYFLFFSPVFQVKKIVISGEQKIKKEELISLAENKIKNEILFFETKSIFLVNLDEIKKEIFNNFPKIARAEIKRGFPDSLNIVVGERSGAANWCCEERCFLLDNEGIIFEEILPEVNSESSTSSALIPSGGEGLIKIVDKQNTKPLTLGERVIEKESLAKILEISPKLKLDLKLPIKEFVISSEEKLEVLTANNWEIYFNLQGDVNWQLTKLKAVLETKIPLEKRGDLEYIELRFGNFAPFRYKDKN